MPQFRCIPKSPFSPTTLEATTEAEAILMADAKYPGRGPWRAAIVSIATCCCNSDSDWLRQMADMETE